MEQWNSYLDLTITDFLNELHPLRKATYSMITGVWLFQKIGVKKPTNLLWVLDSAPFMTVIFEIDVSTGVINCLSSTNLFIPIFANYCQNLPIKKLLYRSSHIFVFGFLVFWSICCMIFFLFSPVLPILPCKM